MAEFGWCGADPHKVCGMLHAYASLWCWWLQKYEGMECSVKVGKHSTCKKPVQCEWEACGENHCRAIRKMENAPSQCAVHCSPAKPQVSLMDICSHAGTHSSGKPGVGLLVGWWKEVSGAGHQQQGWQWGMHFRDCPQS